MANTYPKKVKSSDRRGLKKTDRSFGSSNAYVSFDNSTFQRNNFIRRPSPPKTYRPPEGVILRSIREMSIKGKRRGLG